MTAVRVLLVSVLAAVLTACGGGEDRLTAAEFRDQANEICRDLDEEFERVIEESGLPEDEEPTGEQFQPVAADLADAAEEHLDRLRDLNPPENLEDDYDAYLSAFEGAAERVREAGDDADAAEELIQEDDPFTDVDERAADLELEDCAEGAEEGGDPPADAADVAVWTRDMCTVVGSWVGAVQRESEGYAAEAEEAGEDPDAHRAALVAYVESLLEATDTVIAALEDAGVPNITDGEAVAAEFVGAFEHARDGLLDARDRAESVSDANFAADMDRVSTQIQTAFEEAGARLEAVENPELAAAQEGVPACTALEEVSEE